MNGAATTKSLNEIGAQSLGDGCDVDFTNLPVGLGEAIDALPVKRLIPSTDARGVPTTSTFCSFPSEETIYVPCSLLRLRLDLTEVRLSTLAQQPRSEDPTAAFKIKADDKDKVLMRCRFD